MYLIAGLGNPGARYRNTRHNMGFITLDRLSDRVGFSMEKIRFKGLVGETRIDGERVVFLKPQTYMNNSGESVREAASFFKVPHENLLIVYDDIDIPVGNLRIRASGSAGTHNGMRSCIYQLGFDDFPRIRIGIGSPENRDLINYVTGGFSPDEVPLLEGAVDSACDAILAYVKDGIDIAMNRYNTKKDHGTAVK